MTTKYYVLENIDTCESELIATSFNFTGDFIRDYDNFSSLLGHSFNLWADESMSVLIATSEI